MYVSRSVWETSVRIDTESKVDIQVRKDDFYIFLFRAQILQFCRSAGPCTLCLTSTSNLVQWGRRATLICLGFFHEFSSACGPGFEVETIRFSRIRKDILKERWLKFLVQSLGYNFLVAFYALT